MLFRVKCGSLGFGNC